MTERSWTKRIVTEAWVEVYQGSYFRHSRDMKAAADELARDLKRLIDGHSDWHGADVTVHTKTELRCTFCNWTYEEDANVHICCDRAMAEYQSREETQ